MDEPNPVPNGDEEANREGPSSAVGQSNHPGERIHQCSRACTRQISKNGRCGWIPEHSRNPRGTAGGWEIDKLEDDAEWDDLNKEIDDVVSGRRPYNKLEREIEESLQQGVTNFGSTFGHSFGGSLFPKPLTNQVASSREKINFASEVRLSQPIFRVRHLPLPMGQHHRRSVFRSPEYDEPEKFWLLKVGEPENLEFFDPNECRCNGCRICVTLAPPAINMFPCFKDLLDKINLTGKLLLRPIPVDDSLNDVLRDCWPACKYVMEEHMNNTVSASLDILRGLVWDIGLYYAGRAGFDDNNSEVEYVAVKSFVQLVWQKSRLIEMDQTTAGMYPANPNYLPRMTNIKSFHSIVSRLNKVRRTWVNMKPLAIKACAKVLRSAGDAGRRNDVSTLNLMMREVNETAALITLAFWKHFDLQVLHLSNFLLDNYADSKAVSSAKVFGEKLYNDLREPSPEDVLPRWESWYERQMPESVMTRRVAKMMVQFWEDTNGAQYIIYRMVHQMLIHHNYTKFEDEFRKIIAAKHYSGEHRKQALFSAKADEIDRQWQLFYIKDKNRKYTDLGGPSICKNENVGDHRVPTYIDGPEETGELDGSLHRLVRWAKFQNILSTGFSLDENGLVPGCDYFPPTAAISNMFKYRYEDELLYSAFDMIIASYYLHYLDKHPEVNVGVMRPGKLEETWGQRDHYPEVGDDLQVAPPVIIDDQDEGCDRLYEVNGLKNRKRMDEFHVNRSIVWTFIYYGKDDKLLEHLLLELRTTHNMIAKNKTGMWLFEASCVASSREVPVGEAFRVYSNPYIREIMRNHPMGCMQVKNYVIENRKVARTGWGCAKSYCKRIENPHPSGVKIEHY